MTRSVQRDEVPTAEVDARPVLQQDVRLRQRDELADAHRGARELLEHLRRHSARSKEVVHPREQVVDADAVARREERRVGRMQRHPCARLLTQAPRQAVMVRVDVRDQRGAHVRDREPGGAQPVGERSPRFIGVPARVDDSNTVGEFQRVDDHVAQGVARDRDRDRPEPGAHLFHGGHRIVAPRVAQRRTRDLDQAHVSAGVFPPGALAGAREPSPRRHPNARRESNAMLQSARRSGMGR